MSSHGGMRVGWALPAVVIAVALAAVVAVGLLVSTAEADLPAPPSDVAVEGGRGAVTVGFVAESVAPAPLVEVSLNGSQWLPLDVVDRAGRLEGEVDGLLDGTTYVAQVRIVGRTGTSAPSRTTPASSATTAGDPPAVTVDATVGERQVFVSFEEVATDGEAPAGWRVSAEPVDATARPRRTVCVASSSVCTVRDLAEGVDYRLVVTPLSSMLPGSFLAQTIDGEQIDLGLVSELSAPPAPVGLVAVPLDEALRVTWSPPADEGAGARYEVAVDPEGDAAWTPLRARRDGDVLAATVADLTNGEPVEVSLRLVGDAVPGAAATVEGTPAGRPGRVRDVAVERRGAAVTLRWRAPLETGGAPVRAYVVSGFDGPGCTTRRTGCTVRGVDPERPARFTISADNTTDGAPDTGLGPAVRTRTLAATR